VHINDFVTETHRPLSLSQNANDAYIIDLRQSHPRLEITGSLTDQESTRLLTAKDNSEAVKVWASREWILSRRSVLVSTNTMI